MIESTHSRLAYTLLITVSLLVVGCSQGFRANKLQLSSSSIDELLQLDGAKLYEQNCMSCHGSVDTSVKRGRTASQISLAIVNVPVMKGLKVLTTEQVQAIAESLKTVTPPDQLIYTCTDPNARGKSEDGLRRLTRLEFINTLIDIFGQDVVSGLTSLSGMPVDVIEDFVSEFTPHHSRDHIDAILNIAIEVSYKVVANRTYLTRIAPACVDSGLTAGAITDTCMVQFIRAFGLKVHRRPLNSTQEQNYLASFKDNAIESLPLKTRVETLIAHMMQAPEMQFLWSHAPQLPNAGTRAKVDGYTVASRLSYRLTSGPPDSALMEAAARGDLGNLSNVRQQASRLLVTARGRRQVRTMFDHWLRLGKVPVPSANVAATLGISSDGASLLKLRNDAVVEALDFAEHIVFGMNGTYADLMSSDLAFPKTDGLAKLLGVSGPSAHPIQVADGRRGIFMRPAVLFSSTDRDSPIKRGVSLRTRVLCDEVPPPPADLDGEINEIANSFDHSLFSSREVARKMTGGGTCITCHARLNSLGYALSFFGPLGEYRSVDRSFNSDGSVKKEFPINASATSLDVITPLDSANDHRDLVDLMSRSEKGRACLAAYAFRTSRLRDEASVDRCQLSETEQLLKSGMPIKEALIRNVASEDILWRGY